MYNIQNKHCLDILSLSFSLVFRSKNISHIETIFHSSSNKWFDHQYINTHIRRTNQISSDVFFHTHAHTDICCVHERRVSSCCCLLKFKEQMPSYITVARSFVGSFERSFVCSFSVQGEKENEISECLATKRSDEDRGICIADGSRLKMISVDI